MNRRLFFILIILLPISPIFEARGEVPQIGAQIFIEPGQSEADIHNWFRIMSDNGMTVCRIRMFEEYMRTDNGSWDFTLFDYAFRAAEKYNVKIFATLFPAAQNNTVGGFKFPLSEEHSLKISNYIARVVKHFQKYKSFFAWVLINEPGTGGYIPDTSFSYDRFNKWKNDHPVQLFNQKGYRNLIDFSKKRFLVDYNTWYLQWLADEVRKYDKKNHIHVNNHQIFENVAEYDFPAWQNFLNSLGASAHPSWHFGYFNRSQYAAAMVMNCNIIRSGAGTLPFWVTELQGGNNTLSGNASLCPTQEEITQWLWSSIVSGANGIIFWCFNPRSSGEEAGEWALIDFQNEPSERLLAASTISKTVSTHASLFKHAQPAKPSVHVVYTRESLWIEKNIPSGHKTDSNFEGRQPGGAMKSAISMYNILLENGVNSSFGEINEFDFTQKHYSGEALILAGQLALPSKHWENIRNFVKKGGKLIVEGLSGYYDENMFSLHNTGFPLADVFGGSLKEVKTNSGDFYEPALGKMPIHLWKSTINKISATSLMSDEKQTYATRNKFGDGEVVWVPAMVSLGAWRTGESEPLSTFLMNELNLRTIGLYLKNQHKNVVMQTMQSRDNLITLLINKNKNVEEIEIVMPGNLSRSEIIFADKGGKLSGKTVLIHPEESMVIVWK